MAAPKVGAPGYDRLKAHRLRLRVAAGKPVTEEQRAWLAKYEAEHGGHKPHVTTSQRIESNPIEAQATAVPQTAPPPLEVPPLGSSASTGTDSSPPGDASSAGESTAPHAGPAPSAASQKEAAVSAIVDMAATAWKSGMDKIAKMVGETERMFPDEFVDKIWKPAATRLGVKYLPDSMGSDLADAVVVVGPPAATVFAARRISAQLEAAKKANAEISAKPAGQAEIKPEDAPHAQVPPTSNGEGQRMSKNDIRRAKLEMPKDAVY